jgi:hypothetical protein
MSDGRIERFGVTLAGQVDFEQSGVAIRADPAAYRPDGREPAADRVRDRRVGVAGESPSLGHEGNSYSVHATWNAISQPELQVECSLSLRFLANAGEAAAVATGPIRSAPGFSPVVKRI